MIAALSTNTMEAMLEGSGAIVPVTKLYGGKALQRTERPEVDNWEEATAFLIEMPDKTVALIEISAVEFLNLSS
jgi:hypothetical protein